MVVLYRGECVGVGDFDTCCVCSMDVRWKVDSMWMGFVRCRFAMGVLVPAVEWLLSVVFVVCWVVVLVDEWDMVAC
jgi:hypothetical protein